MRFRSERTTPYTSFASSSNVRDALCGCGGCDCACAGGGQRGVRRVLVDGDDDARRGVEGVARVRPRGCVSVDGRGLVWFGEDGG